MCVCVCVGGGVGGGTPGGDFPNSGANTQLRVPNTQQVVPNTQHRMPNTQLPVPNTQKVVPNTQHCVPNIQNFEAKHPKSCAKALGNLEHFFRQKVKVSESTWRARNRSYLLIPSLIPPAHRCTCGVCAQWGQNPLKTPIGLIPLRAIGQHVGLCVGG